MSCITNNNNNNAVVYINDLVEICNQKNQLLIVGKKRDGLYKLNVNNIAQLHFIQNTCLRKKGSIE